jgi:hypothetical protein
MTRAHWGQNPAGSGCGSDFGHPRDDPCHCLNPQPALRVRVLPGYRFGNPYPYPTRNPCRVLKPVMIPTHHVLSICPNSASCERLFSVYGNILAPHRNRLGNRTLTSLAEVQMHIRDEHVRDGETKKRMKRFFGAKTGVTNQPETTQAQAQAPSRTSQVMQCQR